MATSSEPSSLTSLKGQGGLMARPGAESWSCRPAAGDGHCRLQPAGASCGQAPPEAIEQDGGHPGEPQAQGWGGLRAGTAEALPGHIPAAAAALGEFSRGSSESLQLVSGGSQVHSDAAGGSLGGVWGPPFSLTPYAISHLPGATPCP